MKTTTQAHNKYTSACDLIQCICGLSTDKVSKEVRKRTKKKEPLDKFIYAIKRKNQQINLIPFTFSSVGLVIPMLIDLEASIENLETF